MKIKDQHFGSTTTHYHRLEVEDGPVIDAGNSYIDGTKFKVETIRRRRINNDPWGDVTVRGPRLKKDGTLSGIIHQRVFVAHKPLPDWLADIIADGMMTMILEGSAEEQELEDKNGPFPNPENWEKKA
jgi:hypothetical protein